MTNGGGNDVMVGLGSIVVETVLDRGKHQLKRSKDWSEGRK